MLYIGTGAWDAWIRRLGQVWGVFVCLQRLSMSYALFSLLHLFSGAHGPGRAIHRMAVCRRTAGRQPLNGNDPNTAGVLCISGDWRRSGTLSNAGSLRVGMPECLQLVGEVPCPLGPTTLARRVRGCGVLAASTKEVRRAGHTKPKDTHHQPATKSTGPAPVGQAARSPCGFVGPEVAPP